MIQLPSSLSYDDLRGRLRAVDGQVIVRAPLAGPVTDEWLRRYQRLARATVNILQ